MLLLEISHLLPWHVAVRLWITQRPARHVEVCMLPCTCLSVTMAMMLLNEHKKKTTFKRTKPKQSLIKLKFGSKNNILPSKYQTFVRSHWPRLFMTLTPGPHCLHIPQLQNDFPCCVSSTALNNNSTLLSYEVLCR